LPPPRDDAVLTT